MSATKKRVYAVLSALALTLIMGAYSHGPEMNRSASGESADPATGLWRMADEAEDADGGG